MPENVRVVLAGRNPRVPAWRSDPGWQDILRPVSLRNLAPQDSRALLTVRNIPPEQHTVVLDFTRGYPVALSLVTDVYVQRPRMRFQPRDAPDVTTTLLVQFVQEVPSPAHRAALEASVLVHLMTESLLSQLLATKGVRDPSEWLRGPSFVVYCARGFSPRDRAREALVADIIGEIRIGIRNCTGERGSAMHSISGFSRRC